MPKEFILKMEEIVSYVEDYDIKKGIIKNAEPFAAGVYDRGVDFNAR